MHPYIQELTGLAGAGMLLVCSAFAENLEQSNLIATVMMLFFMLFDGNWISLDKVPVYYRWISVFSLNAYGSQGAIVNEYKGLTLKCTADEVNTQQCFYTSGEDVLFVRGLDDVDVSTCIIGLLCLTIGFRLVALVGVLFFFRFKSPKRIFREMIGMQKDN